MTSKSTIILDLDHTLIHSHEFPLPDLQHQCVVQEQYYVFPRPYLKQFLETLPLLFSQIIIWSAGRKPYVEEICRSIFSQLSYQPHLILSREDCEDRSQEQGEGQPYYVKNLDKIFSDYQADPTRTFIIEDDVCIPYDNEKWQSNCIIVDRYYCHQPNDDVLLSLTKFLLTKPKWTISVEE